MESIEMCQALFQAFTVGDNEMIRSLCAPELQATQNNGPALDLASLISFSTLVLGVVKDFRYEEANRSATENGFVEEHMVRGTLPDGSELNLAVCVVADIADGKIRRLREYVDSAAAQGLIAALS